MLICPKLPVHCTEKDADTFECPHVGFYVGVADRQIHGYCFKTKDESCPTKEEKKNEL